MIFGDIDWNQAMMKGLIGAIIGGLVGLMTYLSKRKTSTDKQEPASTISPQQDRQVKESWQGTSKGRRQRMLVVLAILVLTLGTVLFVVPRLASPATDGAQPPGAR